MLEAIEDAFEFVGRDASALIANLDESFVFVEGSSGEMDLAAGSGEFNGVRDEVAERLKDAIRISPDVDAVRIGEDSDHRRRLAGLLQACGAAQEIFGGAHGELELSLATANAFEVEDVVDEADETIGVADGDLKHLLGLLGTRIEGSAREQAEGPAE